jgi:hypothetical protein
MEIEKVEPEKFGLETTKAAQISSLFTPMLQAMEDLENQKNEIVNHYDLQVGSDVPPEKETSERAKALRIQYKKIRLQTAKAHTEAKAFYLAGGRFVDALKNTQTFAAQGIESELEKIEKHYENAEKEKIEALQKSREEELKSFAAIYLPDGLGSMHEETYKSILTGTKAALKQKEEAERKEEERIKIEAAKLLKEKEEKEEEERVIRLENERLKKEQKEAKAIQDKKDAEAKAIQDKKDAEAKAIQDKKDAQAKAIHDNKDAEAKAIQYKKDSQAKAIQDKKRAEAKTKLDKANKELADTKRENERIEAENKKIFADIAKEKKEKEDRIKAEKEAQDKKEAELQRDLDLIPDMKKIRLFRYQLNELKIPDLSGQEGEELTSDIKDRMRNFSNWVLFKAKQL